jgi:O-antigen/teichoic acid export membrane protein
MNFKNKIFSGSILVVFALFFSSVLNYLYHLICLKFLNIEDYGTFESLVSLSYIIGVLISSINLTTTYLISHSKQNEISSTISEIKKIINKTSLITGIILVLSFPAVYFYFNIRISLFLYIIYIIQTLFSFYASNFQSILQGLLKFKEVSISTIILSILKIVFTLVFVIIGFKTMGALAGFIIGLIFQIIFCRYSLRKFWYSSKKTILKINNDFVKYLTYTTIVNLCLTSLYSTDLLLIKKYFISSQVGIYSAGSILGRIIFFASSMINIVVFPLFVKNKNKKIFLYSFIYLFITILMVNLIFNIFPQYIIKPLTGLNYNEVLKILPSFSIFFTIYSVFFLISQYLLSQKNIKLLYATIISFILQIVLININHSGLISVINQSIYSLIPGIIISIYLIFINKKTYFH